MKFSKTNGGHAKKHSVKEFSQVISDNKSIERIMTVVGNNLGNTKYMRV